MNFFSIIQGFGEYLRKLNGAQDNGFNFESGSVSIFNYTSEFKDYLSSNYGADTSIFSSNLSDLMNMEIVNGQFVDNSSIFSQNGSVNLLNNILSDETVKAALDSDESGDLSKDEINMFLNSISASDNNGENISVEDILAAAQSIQNGEFELSGLGEGITTPEVSGEEAAGTTEKPKKTKSSHHHSKTRSSKDKDGGDVKEKNLDTMSKAELGEELTTASSGVAEKQNKLNSIISGSDSTLSGLKDNITNSYQAYLEQLNLVNKDLAGQVDSLQGTISAKESEIDAKELAISTQENAVADCKSSYDNAVSNKQNLEGILSKLESTDTSRMTNEQKNSLDNKIKAVKEKLTEAESNERSTKAALEEAEAALKTLEEEKTELTTGENGLDKLKEQMSALESEVNTQYPQVGELLSEYNKAKETYEQAKASATESAKAELKTAKDYETKVKSAYQDAENEENEIEYSPQWYNKEFAAKVAQLGKKYAKKMDTVGNCLVGVARAIRELFGLKHTALSPLPKAYLAAEQFRSDPLLSQHFKEVKVSRSELSSLPAGAVVVWNKSEGHPAGHISISLGNGKEASDHIQKQMNRQNAEYTVFYPV